MSVQAIPSDYPRLTPYLYIKGAAQAIDFYLQAFGAQKRVQMAGADGRINHAELLFGDSMIMLAEESQEMGALGPQSLGGVCPLGLHLYVENVDAVFAQALKLGAQSQQEPQTQFYGDRIATLVDPFGYIWHLSTHVEDVSHEETERRARELGIA